MKVRVLAVSLVFTVVAVSVALAQGGKPAPDDREHDFAGKVLGVTMAGRDKQADGGGWWLEKARVRRLGDRYFLVGQASEVTEQYKGTKGTVIWMPLSDIVSISEFDSVEAAKKVVEEYDRADKNRRGTE